MPTFPASDPASPKAPIQTADIIPFPIRNKVAQPAPEQRLVRALGSLNAAMADQQAAVSAWRDVLAELKATTTGLDDSLHRYRASLRTLGSSVSTLRTQARSLEAWADKAAATKD